MTDKLGCNCYDCCITKANFISTLWSLYKAFNGDSFLLVVLIVMGIAFYW